ncbi:MAG: peptide deformylase [Patescibacteria group bacterium]
MILEIKKYPHPLLRKKCKKIKVFDEKIKKLAKNMLETLKTVKGLGLAAPQVGENLSLFVVNFGGKSMAFINPKIIKRKGEEEMEEGCLSFPGLFVKIKRSKMIEVKVQNLDGEKMILKLEGISARIFQHEIDHLKGKLFIDYLPKKERKEIEKKLSGIS